MKKILYTLSCFLLLSTASFAQDDRGNGNKISERMTEYLQRRLNLSKPEAERFGPVFMQYFNDLRNTNQQYRGDRLVLQQKIVDLRLRYRDQFKNIMGEKRSNDVFTYEREFVNEVHKIREERLQNKGQRRRGL
ncbi:MAG TPA: hypothetical protein VGE66_18800 [Chitinophagaceae bacterium]